MRTLTVVMAILAIAGMAQANTIMVDFGEPAIILGNPNPTYLPTAGNWNMAETAGTVLNMIDTTGAATGIDLTTAGFTTDGIGGVPGASNMWILTAQLDYVGCNYNQPSTLTLSGLTAPQYTIRLFGSRSNLAWGAPLYRKGQFSIGASPVQVQDHMDNTTVRTDFTVAPVGGQIVVDVVGLMEGPANIGYAYVNVMEIIVPEPATLSLLALGGLAAIRRRRRR